MFSKSKFSQILIEISDKYDSISKFADESGVNRTYISKYINQKLNAPPSPKLLYRIAEHSKGVVSYESLMQICGHFDNYGNSYASDIHSIFEEIITSLKTASKIKRVLNNFSYFCKYSVSAYRDFLNHDYYYENKTIKNFTDADLYDDFMCLHTLLTSTLIREKVIKHCSYEKKILPQKKKAMLPVNPDIYEVDRRDELLLPQYNSYEFITFNNASIDKMENISKNILSDLYSLYYLQFDDNNLTVIDDNTNFTQIPILGRITAGHPVLAQEYLEGYIPIEPSIYGVSSSDDLFFLRVSGQSMNLKVKDGDYALIHKQDYAEDGDIVVAIVNGDYEATLKRYRKLNEQFILLEPMSTDSSIEAITVDLKQSNFKIIGKAIGQFGKF